MPEFDLDAALAIARPTFEVRRFYQETQYWSVVFTPEDAAPPFVVALYGTWEEAERACDMASGKHAKVPFYCQDESDELCGKAFANWLHF